MNPILPLHCFVPDAEARAWADGRLYLYGSWDIPGDTAYCSHLYHVFSTGDMVHWEDHGVSFRSGGRGTGVPWSDSPLYAPDCVYRDGLYYQYFCLANGGEGVAVSPSPAGPFADASPVGGADGTGIDPAVFIDDDGQAYYYWGQFSLKGAKLNADMRSLDMSSLREGLIDEARHGFHEGASMRKRNGIYYLLYTDISRGRATCISYATGRSPLGPFTKGGVIVDNTGCDPETWNNHGSICEYMGNWYVFYHRSSQGSRFSRRACVEPVAFTPDGAIPEVEMTTQGASAPLRASAWTDAARACLLGGGARTAPVDVAAEGSGYLECLSGIENGAWACYKYVDFGGGMGGFTAEAATPTRGGVIDVRLDAPDGPSVGRCIIEETGGWRRFKTFSCAIAHTAGVHALYLRFEGGWGRLFDLGRFSFAKGD